MVSMFEEPNPEINPFLTFLEETVIMTVINDK